MEPTSAEGFKSHFLAPDFDKDEFIMEQLQTQRLASLQGQLLQFVAAQKREVRGMPCAAH